LYMYVEPSDIHNTYIKVKNTDTKKSNKRNNQNSKFKRQDYHMK